MVTPRGEKVLHQPMGSYVRVCALDVRTIPILRVKFWFAKTLPQSSFNRWNFTGVLETDSVGEEKKSTPSKSKRRPRSTTKNGEKKDKPSTAKRKKELKLPHEKTETDDFQVSSVVTKVEKRIPFSKNKASNVDVQKILKEYSRSKGNGSSGLKAVASNLMKFFCNQNSSPVMVEKYHTVLQKIKGKIKDENISGSCDAEGMKSGHSVRQDMDLLDSETIAQSQVKKVKKVVAVGSDADVGVGKACKKNRKTNGVAADKLTIENGHRVQRVVEPILPGKERLQGNKDSSASTKEIFSSPNEKREKMVAAESSGRVVQGKSESQNTGSAAVERIDDDTEMLIKVTKRGNKRGKGTDLSCSKGDEGESGKDGGVASKNDKKKSGEQDKVRGKVSRNDLGDEVHSTQSLTSLPDSKGKEVELGHAVACTEKLFEKLLDSEERDSEGQKAAVEEPTGGDTLSKSIKAEEVLSEAASGIVDCSQLPSRTSASAKPEGKTCEPTIVVGETETRDLINNSSMELECIVKDVSPVVLESIVNQPEDIHPVNKKIDHKKEKEVTPNRKICSEKYRAYAEKKRFNGYWSESGISRDLISFLGEEEEAQEMEAKYKDIVGCDGSVKENDCYLTGCGEDIWHPSAEASRNSLSLQVPIENDLGTDPGHISVTNHPGDNDAPAEQEHYKNSPADSSNFSSSQHDFNEIPMSTEETSSDKKPSPVEKTNESENESNCSTFFPFEGHAESSNNLGDYETERDDSPSGVRYYNLTKNGKDRLRFPSVTTVLDGSMGMEQKKQLLGWRLNQIKKHGKEKHTANVSSTLNVGKEFHQVRAAGFCDFLGSDSQEICVVCITIMRMSWSDLEFQPPFSSRLDLEHVSQFPLIINFLSISFDCVCILHVSEQGFSLCERRVEAVFTCVVHILASNIYRLEVHWFVDVVDYVQFLILILLFYLWLQRIEDKLKELLVRQGKVLPSERKSCASEAQPSSTTGNSSELSQVEASTGALVRDLPEENLHETCRLDSDSVSSTSGNTVKTESALISTATSHSPSLPCISVKLENLNSSSCLGDPPSAPLVSVHLRNFNFSQALVGSSAKSSVLLQSESTVSLDSRTNCFTLPGVSVNFDRTLASKPMPGGDLNQHGKQGRSKVLNVTVDMKALPKEEISPMICQPNVSKVSENQSQHSLSSESSKPLPTTSTPASSQDHAQNMKDFLSKRHAIEYQDCLRTSSEALFEEPDPTSFLIPWSATEEKSSEEVEDVPASLNNSDTVPLDSNLYFENPGVDPTLTPHSLLDDDSDGKTVSEKPIECQNDSIAEEEPGTAMENEEANRKKALELLMESIQHVLADITDVQALETKVTHLELGYSGTFDCIARYK